MKKKGKQPKLSVQHVAADLKHAEAVKLRAEGLSFEEIAQRVGYASRGTAYKAVKTYLLQHPAEGLEELRQMELQRLNAMQAVIWPLLHTDERLTAVDRLVKLSKRRSEITGMDQPARAPVDADGNTVGMLDGIDPIALLANRLARIAERRGPGRGPGGNDPDGGGAAPL